MDSYSYNDCVSESVAVDIQTLACVSTFKFVFYSVGDGNKDSATFVISVCDVIFSMQVA